MSKVKNALVVGGGMGGLAAAIALAQRGVDVALIEQRPAFNAPGVGLGQPANALRVYRALGVLDQVLSAGFIYDHMTIYDADRVLIAEHKFLLGDEQIPPVCALSRASLHEILLAAAVRAGVGIRLGTHVSAIEDEGDQAVAHFHDGTASRFDLIAGFDGIRSQIRKHVCGTLFTPAYCGFGAWRVQTPRPTDVTGMEFLQGVCGKTGVMPISNDKMYLFLIRPEAADASFQPSQMVDLFRDRLTPFGAYVREVSASLTVQSDIVYSPLEPHLVPWPWHRGRVVIGGDAAHVVAPHLTQGAAIAVEDALLLAHELMDEGSPVNVRLMRYAQKRYARCAFVYTFARQWLESEQAIRTQQQMDAARIELAQNASARIAVSDRILNSWILE